MLDNEEHRAIDDIKSKLVAPHILALRRSTKQFTNKTDACDRQVSCFLQGG